MSFAKSDIREIAQLAKAPSWRLPRGISVEQVGEECRRVALDFVSDTPATKAALTAWLAGPYHSLVTIVEPDPRRAPMRAGAVIEIPAFARAYVLGVLRGMLRTPSDVAFADAAIHDGWIESCCDATGKPGWVPVDRPNMRLTERVLSLVAVDYLGGGQARGTTPAPSWSLQAPAARSSRSTRSAAR